MCLKHFWSQRNDSHEFLDQHFDIINDVIIKLEKSVENLSINYIEIIKNGNSSELIQKMTDRYVAAYERTTGLSL